MASGRAGAGGRAAAPPLAGHEMGKRQQGGVLAAGGGWHPAVGQLAYAACVSG
jgi:hypothetical protein